MILLGLGDKTVLKLNSQFSVSKNSYLKLAAVPSLSVTYKKLYGYVNNLLFFGTYPSILVRRFEHVYVSLDGLENIKMDTTLSGCAVN